MRAPFHSRNLATLLAFAVGQLAANDDTAQRRSIEEVMRRSNDFIIATFPLGPSTWNRSAYHVGNFRAWETLGVEDYLSHSIAWATENAWLPGPDTADADTEACGQTYIDLYRLDPQSVRIAAIESRMNALKASPQSEDDWWWIDAFFMAGPTFVKLGALRNDSSHFAQLSDMYHHMKDTRGLFSSTHGLWYRDASARARSGANTPEFWGRGNGWVITACARVLEELPAGDPRRSEFKSMLQTMAAALLPLQGVDGFWRSNLKFPNHHPNPETSCTAFFTYALAYGVNEGLLDPKIHTPVIMNAWNGLNAIALHPDGKLGFVQAIGSAPNPADYEAQQDYGYGAFLLAGAEILRMLGGPAPIFADAGPDRTIMDADQDFAETVTLDASRSSIRSGGISHYSWWLGSTFLGDGPQLTVEFPHGSHEVTLHAETSDGETLTNTQTLTIIPPRILVTASGSQAENPPEHTLDGSLATRWSQYGEEQWIRYELSTPTVIDHVDIAVFRGNERRNIFDLQVSLDDSTWNTVFSGQSSGTTTALETYPFPSQLVRFIRYWGNGNSGSLWNSVTEVAIPVSYSMPEPADDADGNGLPASWEVHHFGSQGQNPGDDPNGDGVSLGDDFILGNDPSAHDPALLEIVTDAAGQPQLTLHARAAFGPGYEGKTRRFRLMTSTTLDHSDWQSVPGWESVTGDNLVHTLEVSPTAPNRFYRIAAWLE